MRKLRLVLVAIVALLALAGTSFWVYDTISRRRTLAEQAAEIAAHRQAQRAEAPATPAVAAPAAARAAESPAVPAIAWTTQWSDFRGARRDGQYTGPIRTDWKGLAPLWKQPVGAGYASFV